MTYSSPALGSDGTLYLGSEKNVYAIRADGTQQWAFSISDYAISSPTLDETNGTLYIASRDHRLYALDMEDGTLRWQFATDDEVWSSPVLDENGTVYVGSFDGYLYAIDAQDGSLRWRFSTNGEIVSSPAIGPDGTIYIGTLAGRLFAIRPNGSRRWAANLDGDIGATPAIGSDGTIYAATLEGTLTALASDGTPQWTFTASEAIVSSPAIGADGTIYVGSTDGRLYAVDSATGTTRWSPFQTQKAIFSSPVIDAAQRIYVGSSDGNLYAVNAQNGSLVWSFPTSSSIWSSPALGPQEMLYLATEGTESSGGYLYAIGPLTMAIQPIEAPNRGAPSVLRIDPLVDPPPSTGGTLFYRRGGERTFASTPLTSTAGGQFEGTIPASFSTPRGIEYYVTLTDDAQTTFPAFQPAERPVVLRVRTDQIVSPLPLQTRTYRMISVPLALNDASVLGVLSDDYGPYAPTSWRLMRWNGSRYTEFPDFNAAFTPGTALFLITDEGQPFDVEGGLSVDTSQPYTTTLRPGWNHLANPFAFDVAWEDIDYDAEAIRDIAFFDGQQWIQDPARLTVLRSWEGYLVRNQSSQPALLEIPPVEAATGAHRSSKRGAPAHSADGSGGPVLHISAHLPDSTLRDTQNWLGLLPEAALGEDSFDAWEAPPIGDHVRLSILEDERRYAMNFKPLGQQGQRWTLELSASDSQMPASVELRFHQEGTWPDGIQHRVLDEEGHPVSTPAGHVRLSLHDDRPVRRLTVLLGPLDYLEEATPPMELNRSFVLEANYPNPFRTTTTLRYRLHQPARVTLVVYSMMGQAIRTLVDERQRAGHHEIIWDGLNGHGAAVASGVYLCQLRVGEATATERVLLLR